MSPCPISDDSPSCKLTEKEIAIRVYFEMKMAEGTSPLDEQMDSLVIKLSKYGMDFLIEEQPNINDLQLQQDQYIRNAPANLCHNEGSFVNHVNQQNNSNKNKISIN